MNLEQYSTGDFSRGRPAWVELLWLVTQELWVASWLPGSWFRVAVLRAFGAKIGRGVVIKPRVRVKFPWRLVIGNHSWIGEGVWIDNLAQVTIGAHCVLSQDVYLCTGSHDWSRDSFDLKTRPIVMEDHAWLAARSTVAPGATVGRGAIACMASVVTGSLEAYGIYRGHPAVLIKRRKHFDDDHESAGPSRSPASVSVDEG